MHPQGPEDARIRRTQQHTVLQPPLAIQPELHRKQTMAPQPHTSLGESTRGDMGLELMESLEALVSLSNRQLLGLTHVS